ncbi:TetR family transcriptional regulator (plasmid) [Pseudomonas sp. XWY-1]|nr:TetR family transcriptional regulator [Pseudomonas sp. XWY-1]KIC79551.1 TetR family transcriptional regulator [Pseudomonas sp. C5pp]
MRSRLSVGAVRSEETTNAILTAAAEILEERGYAGFTLDAVVSRAESSKPTIYRWWKNKAALIRDVYERSGEASLSPPDNGNLEQDLHEHLRALWQWWSASRSGEVLRSFITEVQLCPESLEEFRKSFLPRRQQVMRRILLRAVGRGDIPGGPAVESAVTLLTGASWLHLLTGNLDAVGELEGTVKLVVNGLRAR